MLPAIEYAAVVEKALSATCEGLKSLKVEPSAYWDAFPFAFKLVLQAMLDKFEKENQHDIGAAQKAWMESMIAEAKGVPAPPYVKEPT